MANSLKESYMRGMKAAKMNMSEMELEDMNIKETDNGGFIVSCNYKSPPSKGKNGGMPSQYDRKEYAFKGLDDVLDFVEETYDMDEGGGGMGKKAKMKKTLMPAPKSQPGKSAPMKSGGGGMSGMGM